MVKDRQVRNGKSFSLFYSSCSTFCGDGGGGERKREKMKKKENRQFPSMKYEVLMRKTQLYSHLSTLFFLQSSLPPLFVVAANALIKSLQQKKIYRLTD
jgi:hypothetical protein